MAGSLRPFNSVGGFSVGEGQTQLVDSNLNVTANAIAAIGDITTTGNISVSGNVVTGNIKTDNYLYANGAPVDFQQVAGSNTEVQFNDDGSSGADPRFTYDIATGNLVSQANIVTGNLFADTINFANGQPLIAANGLLSVTTLDVSGGANIGGIANISSVESGAITATGAITSTSTISANGNITGLNLNTTGVANVGSVSATGGVIGAYIAGDGGNISNIQAGNITGQVANALVAGTVYTAAQPNITSVGTLTGVDVSGTANVGSLESGAITATGTISGTGVVKGAYLYGDGGNISNIQAGNISGQVANALVAGTVYTAAQPNITSVGALTSVEVVGLANVGSLQSVSISATGAVRGDQGFYGDGGYLGNIQAGNISGAVATATNADWVTQGAQANITSVGTLTGLTVDGTLTVLPGNVIYGDGGGLSNIVGGNVTGYVANAVVANIAYSVDAANVNGFAANVNSNIAAYTGTMLNVSNITSSGTITGSNLVTGGSLSVSLDAVITGNLTVQGNTNIVNTQSFSVTDPLIYLGTGANGAPLTSDDNLDRGTVFEYYDGADSMAYAGFKNNGPLKGNLLFATDVSESANNVITVNNYGNAIIGNIAAQGSISATGLISAAGNVNASNAEISGNVTAANVTVTGTLSAAGLSFGNAALSTTGNVLGGNINTVGLVSSVGNVIGGNLVTGGIVQALTTNTTNLTASGTVNLATSGGAQVNIGLEAGPLGATQLSRQGVTTNSTSVANIAVTSSTTGDGVEVKVKGFDQTATIAAGYPVVYTATVSYNSGSNNFVVFNNLGNSMGVFDAYGNWGNTGVVQVLQVTPATSNTIVWTTSITEF